MSVEIKMPKMGLTMTTGEVGRWLKNEGDAVAKGEALVEVMTDKITNKVESPMDGVLLKITAPAGSQLEPSALMGFVGNEGEVIAERATGSTSSAKADAPVAKETPQKDMALKASPALKKAGERIFITPVARKIATEHGYDYSSLTGTGPGGRIVKADILKALESQPQLSSCAGAEAGEVLETIPYLGMRRAIGENMFQSWNTIPRVTQHTSVVLDNLLALRKEINASLDPENKVSITDMLIKISARALSMHPLLNAVFDGTELKIMKDVNMGVAVALDGGLIVPNIKKANQKSLSAISSELKELAEKAKNSSLESHEISGGSITLSNLGGYRSIDNFTPIINPPEVAILGIGRGKKAPIVKNDEVVVGTVMGISLTHDHRVVDGAPAAKFLASLVDLIENPLKGIL